MKHKFINYYIIFLISHLLCLHEEINSLGQDHCFRTPVSILLYVHHSSWWYFFLLPVGAKTFCTKTKDNTVNPIWNEDFDGFLVPCPFFKHGIFHFWLFCFWLFMWRPLWTTHMVRNYKDWCLLSRQSIWWRISWKVQ